MAYPCNFHQQESEVLGGALQETPRRLEHQDGEGHMFWLADRMCGFAASARGPATGKDLDESHRAERGVHDVRPGGGVDGHQLR